MVDGDDCIKLVIIFAFVIMMTVVMKGCYLEEMDKTPYELCIEHCPMTGQYNNKYSDLNCPAICNKLITGEQNDTSNKDDK